jgi:hypothetical protein
MLFQSSEEEMKHFKNIIYGSSITELINFKILERVSKNLSQIK